MMAEPWPIVGADGLIDLEAALVPAPLFSSSISNTKNSLSALPQPSKLRATPTIPSFVPITARELKATVMAGQIQARIAMLEKADSGSGSANGSASGSGGRSLKDEYAAMTRAVGIKKGKNKGARVAKECKGPAECGNMLCDHNYSTTSTPDQESRERRLKLAGLLVATARKQGFIISTNYAVSALQRSKEKLLDALAWVKDDITKREETLRATGRINWNKEMAIHDMQKKFIDAAENSVPETRDQRLRFLEEDDRHVKEIALKRWNSTYAQSLMAQHPNNEEERVKIFNAYLFEAHFRENRSKYYMGLKNQGILGAALDKFMEQWDGENDEQNYVIHSMKTTGTGEEMPAYSARREQENSLMGRLPAYSSRHGSKEASSSGTKTSVVPLPGPLKHLQDAQAAAAEERGKRIDLIESTEIIDFLNDPRGAEIIFRKLTAHEMDLLNKFEYVKWLFRQGGLGFKAKERLTNQAKLYLEHVRAIHYKDYDLVEQLIDGTQIITFVPKNKSHKSGPDNKVNTTGEQAGESSQSGGGLAGKHPSELATDPDTAPPFHLGISKPEFQRACDDIIAEKQHEETYREPRVGGPGPAPYISPFPKAAMPKTSHKNLARLDSTCAYSSAPGPGKGKGKERDPGLAQAMMAELANAKKTANVPEVVTPKRASQSLFQRLMKGKYEPAFASQSSSAAPTSNPQSSPPKFFFKPKYIPIVSGPPSSALPMYKPNNSQEEFKSRFKEMVVDEDGEPVIGEFHDVSDDDDGEDNYNLSDYEDGNDAGDEDSEANFDPDETAVEGGVEQQDIPLSDAEREEAMLRYQDIQAEGDEQDTTAALEMAEVVGKLSHNIRGLYFNMLQQHLMLGGGKLYNGPYSPDTIAKFFTLLEEPPIEGIKVRTVTELLGICGNSPARAHVLYSVLLDQLDIFYIREDVVDPDFPMYEKEMLKFCNFVWKRCCILAKRRME